MTGTTSNRAQHPLDAALTLLVYAPVGLVAALCKELPKLAAAGRDEVERTIRNSRVVGEFVVKIGRDKFDAAQRAERSGATRPEVRTRPAANPARDSRAVGHDGAASEAPAQALADVLGPVVVESLAIAEYDSLAASQVVLRLTSLSHAQLRDVASYEQAHRGRRTILHRVDQLLA